MGCVVKDYQAFIASKHLKIEQSGFDIDRESLNPKLFDHQKDIVRWALKLGKAAIFADTGLGKSFMQAEWAHRVHLQTQCRVLILAPLAVAKQTVREGEKLGIPINYCRRQSEVRDGITITNYEMLHDFDPSDFIGVALDESSRIKNYTSKTRDEILTAFEKTPYKSAWTATPAPNDHMELGNHAEFLGAMTRVEMLSMYFTHDGGETSKWRLKGHAQRDFWRWVATWAVVIRKPSDLGYEDDGYKLPPLNLNEVIVSAPAPEGMLFYEAQGLQEQNKAKRNSLEQRVAKAAEIIASKPNESWVIWCELNDESAALAKATPDAVEIRGSDSIEKKEAALEGFSNGHVRVLISKASITGFGMNWQHCANTLYVGISNSYEMFYQSLRRFYRFGQTREVNAYLVFSEAESAIMRTLKRKSNDAEAMQENMLGYISEVQAGGLKANRKLKGTYNPQVQMTIPEWIRSEAASTTHG